ncbi:MAG: minE [Rhizobium sp.]|nr:minE [Rhizobium sp.]
MNIFWFFRKHSSAPMARERLQILLSHERSWAGQSDLVSLLREEILAAISKHIQVDNDKVHVKMDRDVHFSKLEIEVEIPLDSMANAA